MTGETSTATTRAHGGDREGELAGARADVDDHRVSGQPQLLQEGDLLDGAGVLLAVIARHVLSVEVLPSGAGHLIEQPPGHGPMRPGERHTRHPVRSAPEPTRRDAGTTFSAQPALSTRGTRYGDVREGRGGQPPMSRMGSACGHRWPVRTVVITP
jgi:hypothetical protein